MNDSDIVESIARGMVERFGAGAAGFVLEQAEIANALLDPLPAATWRDIGNAIERLHPKP
jgi:hypothetical protein